MEGEWESLQTENRRGAEELKYTDYLDTATETVAIPVNRLYCKLVGLSTLSLDVLTCPEPVRSMRAIVGAGVDDRARLVDGPDMLEGDNTMIDIVPKGFDDILELLFQDVVEQSNVLGGGFIKVVFLFVL